MKAPPCFEDSETKRIIREICEHHAIDAELLKGLCELPIEAVAGGCGDGLAKLAA